MKKLPPSLPALLVLAIAVSFLPAANGASDPIDPYLSTPAAGALYDIPVVVIRYIPTTDGVNVNTSKTGYGGTVASLVSKIDRMNKQTKFSLEEGSKFRGYKNAGAPPSLGYRVVGIHTFYEEAPRGLSAGGGAYFPDMNNIIPRVGGQNYVQNLGVKEFWLWVYHYGDIVPVESNMASPTTGDISNSYRNATDMPIYNKTYVAYSYNFGRSSNEAVHNHGHQQEAQLSYVNNRQDGNTTLWQGKFVPYTRCGNTHRPPNTQSEYDYTNGSSVQSDIEDWKPAGGATKAISANTWGGINYAWPDGVAPTGRTEGQYYIYWFQAYPGFGNAIPNGASTCTNWWRFTAEWDAAITGNYGLYGSGGGGGSMIQFSSSTYNVNETAGNAVVTVTRTSTTGAATVQYSTANGTAAAGSDYTGASGTLSFAAGEASKTFSVPITNDILLEADETISLSLSNASAGFTLGNPSSSTLTILDDEARSQPGQLKFSKATYTVDEAVGNAVLTVQRVNGSSGTVTVAVSSVDLQDDSPALVAGKASVPSDYAPTAVVLTFGPGMTSRTVSIPIVNDTAIEPNENFTVGLMNPTGGATLISPSATSVVVTNNDPTIADLVVSAPTAATVGTGKLKLTVKVTNSGFAATPAGFDVKAYLSTDGILDPSDPLIWTTTRSTSLPVGSVYSPSTTVWITGVNPGTRTVFFVADPVNMVVEVSEANNQGSATNNFKPNLEFTGNSWSNTESSVTATLTVKNRGPARVVGPIAVSLYLSTDSTIKNTDILMGSYTTTSAILDSDQTEQKTVTYDVPAGTPIGIYYIGALVDPANLISEWDENNNWAKKGTTETLGPPGAFASP